MLKKPGISGVLYRITTVPDHDEEKYGDGDDCSVGIQSALLVVLIAALIETGPLLNNGVFIIPL